MSNAKVKNLLPFVRKGSKSHLLRLADSWPEEPSGDLIDATGAVLFFLASRGQPGERLSIEDLEIAQACFFGISRALRATHPSKSDDPAQHEELRDTICSLILNKLEPEIAWMGKCIRYSRVLAEENHSIVQGACRLVARCAWTFAQQLSYHEDLKSAMQALPVAARTLSDIWCWTEPVNNIPLCIIGTALKDDFWKGCGIIDSMYLFTHGSGGATLLVLSDILRSKPQYPAAADEFVRLSTDRVQMLEQACRAPKRTPPLILKSLTHIIRIVTNFVLCGDHYIMKALQKRPFLQHFISALFLVSTNLWSNCDEPEELPASECLAPLRLVHEVLPRWANAFPSSTYVMYELLDGSMNLPLLLLSTIASFQRHDILRKCPEEFAKTALVLFRNALDWVISFTIYPALSNKLFYSFRDVDSGLLNAFCSLFGDWTVTLWQQFTHFLKGRAELHNGCPRTDLCDNILHEPTASPARAQGPQRSCSACHSALYCSERCQREDWKSSHRDDCEDLRQIYIKRKRSHRWTPGLMRLSLLKIVEDRLLKARYIPPSSHSITVLDFSESFYQQSKEPIAKPMPEYAHELEHDEKLQGVGGQRMDAIIREMGMNPRIRIICATFPYRGLTLEVMARVRVSLDGSKVALVGGFDFIQAA